MTVLRVLVGVFFFSLAVISAIQTTLLAMRFTGEVNEHLPEHLRFATYFSYYDTLKAVLRIHRTLFPERQASRDNFRHLILRASACFLIAIGILVDWPTILELLRG